MLKDYFVLQVDGISTVGQLYLPGKKPEYPAVCVCHGIPSGNPPDPSDGGYPALAERICGEGLAVVIFNFRGAGDSGGNFDMLGWSRDLNAVIGHLSTLKNIDKTRLALLGFSGGAAVSIYVASKDKRVSCVAACASPADFNIFIDVDEPKSIVDRFRRIGIIQDAGFPPSIGQWLDAFRAVTPVNHVAKIAPRPLLLVHGNKDETVDISHARRLYERAGEPKELVVIEGGGHRVRQDNGAMDKVISWLKSRCQLTN